MGSDTMTAASAPEEGRRCWLKVIHNGKSRLVEWNTAWSTFKDLDTKVHTLFGIKDKVKLSYTYECKGESVLQGSVIQMSSDEELGTALHLMVGDFLLVTIGVITKSKRGPVHRAIRAAKAQQPRIARFITLIPATVAACVSSVPIRAGVERIRAAARACCTHRCRRYGPASAAPNAEPNADAAPERRPPRARIFLGLFMLFAAIIIAANCDSLDDDVDINAFYHHHAQQHQRHNAAHASHATILAASYGGVDVTAKAQTFYNKHSHLVASNKVFGDTSPGQYKYLHVVYQLINKQGVPEVFSQSLPEGGKKAPLAARKSEHCNFEEYAQVNGNYVRVMGALYDGSDATCAARRLASYGRFQGGRFDGGRVDFVHPANFGVTQTSGTGTFTMVYMANNNLKMLTAKDGQQVVVA